MNKKVNKQDLETLKNNIKIIIQDNNQLEKNLNEIT